MKELSQTVEGTMLESVTGLMTKLLGVLLIFLAPIKAVMLATGFLIMADLITGVWAAHKRKEKITSNGLRNTITKMFAYQACIITGFVVESHLLPEIPFVKVIAAMIAITEVKSFFENMHVISGIDFWSELLKKVHGNKLFPRKKDRKK